jgi:hypothetical protein
MTHAAPGQSARLGDHVVPQRRVLLRGGRVSTPVDPFATAMLVVGDRVAWVGQDGAADAYGTVDELLDLDGALVTPAFVDAHVHCTETALAALSIDLGSAPSRAAALQRVAEAAADLPRDALVVGHGWDDSTWPEAAPLTAELVTSAVAGRAAYLARVDGHSAAVSQALAAAVPGLADLAGWAADGLLSGTALHAVRLAVQATVSTAQRQRLQEQALRSAAHVGIAAVHEMAAPHISGYEDLVALLDLRDASPALPDVLGYWGAPADAAQPPLDRRIAGRAGDLRLDGTFGSRSAWLSQPYAQHRSTVPGPTSTGVPHLTPQEAADHVVACTRAGIQGGFHAIGDAAVATAIRALEAAERECGTAAVVACRHRLEHVELLPEPAADTIDVLARLGVMVSAQPAFDARWGGQSGMYADRLGPERAARTNPFAAFVRSGVGLAFGSDSPVMPFDPWGAVRAAATHHTPEQRLTVRAAFAAHTRGGWRAAGVDEAGVLAPGMLASYAVWAAGDLVVATPDERVAAWSTDPRAGVPGLPDLDGPTPRCLRTVARGRVVHDLLDAEVPS